jgi:cytochrome P450
LGERHVPRFPPGPARSLRSLFIYGPGADPLGFFTELARTYGDLVHVRMANERLFLIGDPRHVRDVLVTHQHKFHKGRGLERTRRLLGQGLLTSEDALPLRQRRLMQPAVLREAIASYAGVMTDYASRLTSTWTDGAVVDVSQEMTRLTLGVVGKTLFDADVESQARDIGDALTAVMESFWLMMLPFSNVLERLPVPALRRARAARDRLDAIIYRMIAERRRAPTGGGDLLSMLLLVRDEQEGMSDTQVRDEAMTLFLAGHETTATALAWTWYLVGQSPEVESRLHEEVDRVLDGREPGIGDIGSLPFVEKVVTESMRLYPPAWIIGRRVLQDYAIDGYVAPARSIVIISPYLLHRDPRFYPEPERFKPDRWTPEFKASLPPFAYVPFGGGTRRCIGESFAMMELMLVVSAIAQKWRLRLVPGHPVVPQPVITLRLKHGLKMSLHRRAT